MLLSSFLDRVGRTLLLAPLLLSLAACSEGGESDPFDGVTPDAGPSPLPPGDGPMPGTSSDGFANGPLRGRVIRVSDFFAPNSIIAFDLRSGLHARLPVDSARDDSRFLGNPNVDLWLEPDRSAPGRMLATLFDCDGEAVNCVGFMDAASTLESAFAYDEVSFVNPGTGAAKRSRDGRFVALTTDDTTRLEIRSTDGDVVSSGEFGYQIGSPYDWLPNGGILIAEGDTSDNVVLFETAPYSTEVVRRIDLPERYDGTVRFIRISPDGGRAMLQIDAADGNYERPVVLDLATNDLYEPVERRGVDQLDASGVVWSPDGRWLIFVDANRTYVGPLFVDVRPEARDGAPMYAVRADGGSYPLPRTVAESNDDARVVVARPLVDDGGALGPENARSGGLWVE